MLEVAKLTVRYGQHRALEDAALRVDRGEIVVILGANGAGKSTLLKAISGVCEGSVSGSVRLDGTELTGLPAHRIVEEGVALVPEGRGVFGELTVRENLVLGAYSGRARDEEEANLARVYALFPKLKERGRQVVRTMSGGEQQMVAIGRAMMSNPQILTLDEPSLGLSPLLSKELFANLKRVRELGLGILLVEQNARQSLAIADRGYLLENAHIVHEASAESLRNDPAVQAAYLGAGAAAAPHTHDEAVALATEEAPAAFAVRPRSLRARPADVVLGRSIDDLVADAAARASASVAERRAGCADRRPAAAKPAERLAATSRTKPAPGAAGDRLAAAIADIERAAKAARARVREHEMPRQGATAPRSADAPAARGSRITDDRRAPAGPPAAEDRTPVTVEVYRAPRVEVWRKRPGSKEFDRD